MSITEEIWNAVVGGGVGLLVGTSLVGVGAVIGEQMGYDGLTEKFMQEDVLRTVAVGSTAIGTMVGFSKSGNDVQYQGKMQPHHYSAITAGAMG